MLFFRLVRMILSGVFQCHFFRPLLFILSGLYLFGYLIKCFKQIGKQ